jgi:5-methylcytosine-specific restriction endonuclease McrA
MNEKIVGRANFRGWAREGCPRCCGDAPMSTTQYKGNGNIKKFCCIECEPEILEQKRRAVERAAKWRASRDDIRAYRNEEARKYRSKHHEAYRATQNQWYHKNHDKARDYANEYRKEHPEINRVSAAKRRASVKERTVPWSELEAIKEFYKNCPDDMVVDHIIPLKGEGISGLHVLFNLQYLTFEENAKKGRKFYVC